MDLTYINWLPTMCKDVEKQMNKSKLQVLEGGREANEYYQTEHSKEKK